MNQAIRNTWATAVALFLVLLVAISVLSLIHI